MLGFKTEGIILKRINLGEADRILTVFSLHRGKISVLAKGVRRITSRRSGNVELLNRVQMYLYPGKNFLILTEAQALDTFAKLKEDLNLSTYAFHILELTDKLTAENQENRLLYEHLFEVLKRLSSNPRQILVRAYEAKILSNLGFETFKADGVNASHPRGDTGRQKHSRSATLEDLEIASWNEIERITVTEKEAMELEQILRYHIERVLEEGLKSRLFLKRLPRFDRNDKH